MKKDIIITLVGSLLLHALGLGILNNIYVGDKPSLERNLATYHIRIQRTEAPDHNLNRGDGYSYKGIELPVLEDYGIPEFIEASFQNSDDSLKEFVQYAEKLGEELERLEREEYESIIQIRDDYVDNEFAFYDPEIVADYLNGIETIPELREHFVEGSLNDSRLVNEDSSYIKSNFFIAALELLKDEIVEDLQKFITDFDGPHRFDGTYSEEFYKRISDVAESELDDIDTRALLTAMGSLILLDPKEQRANTWLEQDYITIKEIFAEQGTLYRELRK